MDPQTEACSTDCHDTSLSNHGMSQGGIIKFALQECAVLRFTEFQNYPKWFIVQLEAKLNTKIVFNTSNDFNIVNAVTATKW